MDEHREGLRYLATALQEVVDRRGKRDLREWGGPAAGTVRAILDGTWATSPQTRGTFEKLDAAGPWREGTARLLYLRNPTAIAVLEDGAEYLRSDLDTPSEAVVDKRLSDPLGKVASAAEGAVGERASAVQVEAVREFITTLRAALDALEDAFDDEDYGA